MNKVFIVLAITSLLTSCKKKAIDEIKPETEHGPVNMFPTSIELFYEQFSSKSISNFTYKNGKIFKVENFSDTGAGYNKQESYVFEYDGERIKSISMVGFSSQLMPSFQLNYNYDQEGRIIEYVQKQKMHDNREDTDSIKYYYTNSDLKYFVNHHYIGNSPVLDFKDSTIVKKELFSTGTNLSLETFTQDINSRGYFSGTIKEVLTFDLNENIFSSVMAQRDTVQYHYSKQKDVLSDLNYLRFGKYGSIICPQLKQFGMNLEILKYYSAQYNVVPGSNIKNLTSSVGFKNEIYSDEYGRISKEVSLDNNNTSFSTSTYHY